MKAATFIWKFFISLSALVGLAAIVTTTVYAAPPNIEFAQGAIRTSSPDSVYSPTSPGPVSFTSSGCPRWSGTINRTNLATNAISSNITQSKLHAGDTVTFAITMRNTSDTAAFDVALKSSPLPSGLEVPGTGAAGANLCVTNGAGTAVGYTTSGTGFFGTTANDHIELNDGSGGAIAPSDPTNGQDIIIVTFDLRIATNFNPESSKTVESELINYSASEGGVSLDSANDSTTIVVGLFQLTKTLQATSQPSTTGNDVVVGEIMTYSLTITVPEGVISNTRIEDTMSDGLAFVECVSVTNNSPASVSTDMAGGFSAACNDPTNPTVNSDGEVAIFTLGNLTNADRNQATEETITFVYRAVVNNTAAAANSANLNNSAVAWWDTGNSMSASAPVIVREPKLQSLVTVTPQGNLKPGDTVTVRMVLSHASASEAIAFEALARNVLPSGLTFVPGTLNCGIGTVAPAGCTFAGGVMTAQWAAMPLGETAIVEFQAQILADFSGTSIPATTAFDWSSLPGDAMSSLSDYTTTAVERTGNASAPGGAANNYNLSPTVTLAVNGSGDSAGTGQEGGASSGSATDATANTGAPMMAYLLLGATLLIGGAALGIRAVRSYRK